jgi:hypothetical protein
MLSEIFMLRLEAIFRASNPPTIGVSDTRFVPIKPPVDPAKDSQQAGKQALEESPRKFTPQNLQ